MVILAQYHSNRADNDSPFDINADIRVRILTNVERTNGTRDMTRLWETVTIPALYSTIQCILDQKENLNRSIIQETLAHTILRANSNGRYGITQVTTVYDSDAPNRIRISIEINEL